MRKTLLFDLDGTLIDSTPAILNSFKSAFENLALKVRSDEEIKALIGFPLEEMFAKLCPTQIQLTQAFIQKYREKYSQIYLEQTMLLAGVKEALILADRFADLAVVTTKGGQFTKPLLDFLGVADFFKTIITKDDVSKPKPDSEPILLALSRLKKSKENAFMIGDTRLDVLAAKNAGISSIALACGYESKESLKNYTLNIKNNAYEAVLYLKNL